MDVASRLVELLPELRAHAHQVGGGEVRIAVLQAGDIFGEMAILQKEVRSATVRTLTETRLLTVDKKTFLSRVHEDPSLAFNIVRMMAQRIRTLNAKLGERRARVERRRNEAAPALARTRIPSCATPSSFTKPLSIITATLSLSSSSRSSTRAQRKSDNV